MEVLDVLCNEVVEVPQTERHEVVQALTLDRAHPSLGEGVQLGKVGGQALAVAPATARVTPRPPGT